MRTKILIVSFFSFLISADAFSDSLNVYTYDSLLGKNSLGEVLKNEFQKKTGSNLNFFSYSSGGEALNQIILEGAQTKADILLGIDNSFAERAESTQMFLTIPPELFKGIEPQLRFDKGHLFLPFDYGYLAFIYNKEKISKGTLAQFKTGLANFLSSELISKKIVIEDPRTSSLGFSFLRWTQELFSEPEALRKCWEMFFPKLVTLSPSWSGAYGLFLKGEADWVLSYTTSVAFHQEKERKANYEALIFDGGNATQIEAAAVLKTSKKKSLNYEFLKVLKSDEVQRMVPLTQWMYPVNTNVALPSSFKELMVPKSLTFNLRISEIQRKKLISDWTRWTSGAP